MAEAPRGDARQHFQQVHDDTVPEERHYPISAEQLDHETERVSQFQLLEVFVNRGRRIERGFQRTAARVSEFRQTLGIWLRALRGQPNERTSVGEESAVEAAALLEDAAKVEIEAMAVL